MALLGHTGRVAAIAMGLLVLAAAGSPVVAAQGVSEPALKAAFLFNFAKFTEWPDDPRGPTAPIVFCSTDDDVASALESSVAGRLIAQHPVVVNRVTVESISPSCGLLYTRVLESRKLAAMLGQTRGAGLLLVGETEAFVTSGGAIGFFVDGGRMRFAINARAADRAGVRLSAKLLTLAKLIKE
jgi:hypothetical protein